MVKFRSRSAAPRRSIEHKRPHGTGSGNTKEFVPCAQEGCQDQGTKRIAGFCPTDYSGWRTILPLSTAERSHRAYMRTRLANRYRAAAGMVIRHVSGLTVGKLFGNGEVRAAVPARRSRRFKR